MKQKFFIVTLSLSLATLPAVAAEKPAFKRPPSAIETAKIVKQQYGETLDLFGTVHAGQSATVRAEVAGSIVFFPLEVGDKVRAGQTVCTVDPSRYEIAVASAKSELAQATASLEKASMDLKRTRSLFDKKIASQQMLQDAEVNKRIAEADKDTKEARLSAAERDLELTSIKAPFSGYLAQKHLDKGDYVKSGDVAFDIVDLSSPYVLVSLPEKDLGRVDKNAPATISFDAYQGVKLTGKVTHISPRTSTGSRGFEMRIGFKDPKDMVRDGLFARVGVTPETRSALMAPKDAIVERGPMTMVFKLTGDTVKQVNVKVLSQRGDMVEISGELAEGDEVAVTGNEILGDGASVNVTIRR